MRRLPLAEECSGDPAESIDLARTCSLGQERHLVTKPISWPGWALVIVLEGEKLPRLHAEGRGDLVQCLHRGGLEPALHVAEKDPADLGGMGKLVLREVCGLPQGP